MAHMFPRPALPPTGAAVTVTVSGVVPVYLVGALAVQIRDDLHLGPARLGLVVAAFFAASALASFTVSRIVDRLGVPRVMGLAALLAATSLALIGGLVGDSWALLGALLPAGVANGIGQPAANALIAMRVAPGRQGLAYGVKQAAIPSSTLLGGLAVPLIAVPLGWRWAFGIAAVGALLAAAAVPPLESPLGGVRRRILDTPAAGPFRLGPLVVLTVGLTLGAACANSLGGFFVASSVAAGLTASTAGILIAIGSAAGVVTRIGLGVLADRAHRPWLLVVAGLMTAGAGAFALLAVSQLLVLSVAVVIAYCTGWAWAGLATYAITRMHPRAPARATGVTQGGVAIGAAVGPLAFGMLAATASYEVAWLATATALLLAAGFVVLGRRLLLRHRPALVASLARRCPQEGVR